MSTPRSSTSQPMKSVAVPQASSESTPSSGAGTVAESLSVPCDLYGLFVAEPLQLDRHVDGWLIVLLVMIRAFLFIALNFTIQMLYVVRIHKLSVEMQGEQCRHKTAYMQVICVFVFGISIFRELRNCVDFMVLVYRSPVSRNRGYVGIGNGDGSHRHGAVLHEENKGPTASILSWARRRSLLSKTHTWTLGSMTYSWKCTCFLCVGLPRLLIGLLFAKVGAGFIVRAEERDIIIDTVAVLFVVDIGTFMYNAFTTNSVKQQVERAKPVEWFPSNTHRVLAFVFVNFAYPVLLIAFSIAAVWYSRKACDPSEDFQSTLKAGEKLASADLREAVDFVKEMMSLDF